MTVAEYEKKRKLDGIEIIRIIPLLFPYNLEDYSRANSLENNARKIFNENLLMLESSSSTNVQLVNETVCPKNIRNRNKLFITSCKFMLIRQRKSFLILIRKIPFTLSFTIWVKLSWNARFDFKTFIIRMDICLIISSNRLSEVNRRIMLKF